MRVVEAIHARLPNIHLVMHGSSSVPQELQDRFNAYGGAMRQTAQKIKVLPMSAMAKRYASGNLDPSLVLRRTAAE
jgi:fructose/tagatose bisphosphate aldolase